MEVVLLVLALLLPAPSGELARAPSAAEVLASWDAERSSAWAEGDVRRLRGLYTPGSVAGERDSAMLARWLARDLVVTGLGVQVLSIDEVSRTDVRWELRVVDRVVGGTAGGVGLPVDEPTARTIVLRLVGGEWLVSSVR